MYLQALDHILQLASYDFAAYRNHTCNKGDCLTQELGKDFGLLKLSQLGNLKQ